ncbi:MAG: hypothetical protein RIT14_2404 [Pseudomonadota bacterium]
MVKGGLNWGGLNWGGVNWGEVNWGGVNEGGVGLRAPGGCGGSWTGRIACAIRLTDALGRR